MQPFDFGRNWGGGQTLLCDMANPTKSKFNIDGTVYDLCDEKARSDVAGSLRYIGAITASTDINNLSDVGIYQVGSSNPNYPISGTIYGTLIQFPSPSSYFTQMLIAGSSSNCSLYFRRYQKAATTWTAWVKVSGEALATAALSDE